MPKGLIIKINAGSKVNTEIIANNIASPVKNPKYMVGIKLDKTKMLLQIHDELVFECQKSHQKEVEKVLKKTMESVSSSEHHMFTIPLDVNINSGNNWDEAH